MLGALDLNGGLQVELMHPTGVMITPRDVIMTPDLLFSFYLANASDDSEETAAALQSFLQQQSSLQYAGPEGSQ